MTRTQEIDLRMSEIRDELLKLERLENAGRVADAEKHSAQVVALTNEFDALDREARQEIARFAADPRNTESDGDFAPNLNRNRDPFEGMARSDSPGEMRGRALKSIERWEAPDSVKEAATRALESVGGADDALAAQADVRGVSEHIVRFGNPAYVSAFRKYMANPTDYQADLTRTEAEVWRAGRLEARTILNISGAVLPSPLDPTIILDNDGVVDPMRQIARRELTASDELRFIVSPGSTFSFDGELAEVGDDTPTESEKKVTVHKAQGFIEASLEAAMDQPGFFSSEVGKIIGDAKMRLEGQKFITGTGSIEPWGLETRLVGSSSEVSPTVAETFSSADVYKTAQDLAPRWRPGARWMAELSTINAIDQMETTNGAKLFPQVGNADPILLRRPLHENNNMGAYSAINTATTDSTNAILVQGDFRQYAIVDRVGMVVNYIPPGFIQGSTTNRPYGSVGWYTYWRVGGDTLTVKGFSLLNIPTSGS